ncbi:Chaperone protein DnaJ [Botrimarina hoheduenensis]|uniref:Chaperone protein DnaJ n=1 Tax=Botrimarina hoheduenensis TaxID=2528000 RepID=A0A5C5VRV9_9BACT|nr:Chaperone protein DnaJ [Botrimarina hoheduenensis]
MESKQETCLHCGGSGQIPSWRLGTLFGIPQTTQTCPRCHGTGKK